jgi:predicted lipid-binding transport protein (Tim44 family)
MAKKSKSKATPPLSNAPAGKNISVTRQAVGGVTGAVIGGMVAGPVGAIAGGVAGAIVGEQSARGKRPVARTADTIGEEIRKGTPIKALKSVASATTSLGRPAKPSAKSKESAGRKKKKKSTAPKTAAKKSKAKSAKSGAKAKKRAKKKGAKKR